MTNKQTSEQAAEKENNKKKTPRPGEEIKKN